MRERRKLLLLLGMIKGGASYIWKTITGSPPLEFTDAKGGLISKLIQKGKVSVSGGEITCNNGVLMVADDELPIGYKRLIGIDFDGHFWYETGEALTGEDDVTMMLDNTSASGQNVFGSYNGTGSGRKNFSLYIYGSTASTSSYFRYGDQLKRPVLGNGRRTITFGKSGTSGFSTDVSVESDEFSTPSNTYIGMLPNSSSPEYTGNIIGSILVGTRLEWIPCENPSGVIGYYEKYNGNFLEPVGSGTPVSLGYDTSHQTVLSVEGAPEVLTVSPNGDTAIVEDLYAVGDIRDEQDIITGRVVARTATKIYHDGDDVPDRYIGELVDGNPIVYALEDKYEGDVVTFEASEVVPMRDVKVHLEPIQDLHGYDSPWPGGGGKNKVDYDTTYAAFKQSDGTFRGRAGEVNVVFAYIPANLLNTAVTFSAMVDLRDSGDLTQCLVQAVVGGSTINGNRISNGAVGVSAVTFTPTSETDYVHITFGSNGGNYFTFSQIQLESGSTATSWTPYSNICPISGRDSVEGTRTGKNLWHGQLASGQNIPFYTLPGKTYTVSAKKVDSSLSTYFAVKRAMGLSSYAVGYIFSGSTAKDVTFTAEAGIQYFLWSQASYANVTDIQIELGSTATAYEPYIGTPCTIPLPETVYGGDVGVVSGEGENKMGMVDMGTLNWSYYSWTPHGLFYAIVEGKSLAEGNVLVCSALKYLGSAYGGSAASLMAVDNSSCISAQNSGDQVTSKWVYVRADEYGNDVAAFKAAMSGVQLCYELATPTALSTTPTEISTVEGQNNVFSPDGDVTVVLPREIEYYVDPQPLSLAKGDNELSVTAEVDDIPFEATYQAKNNE